MNSKLRRTRAAFPRLPRPAGLLKRGDPRLISGISSKDCRVRTPIERRPLHMQRDGSCRQSRSCSPNRGNNRCSISCPRRQCSYKQDARISFVERPSSTLLTRVYGNPRRSARRESKVPYTSNYFDLPQWVTARLLAQASSLSETEDHLIEIRHIPNRHLSGHLLPNRALSPASLKAA